jgi:endo-1,4-beta-xylanase
VDAAALAIVTRHFNTITAENLLKWQLVHPAADRFAFEPADRFVAFGAAQGMAVIGHTLVWHQQTPAWVFAGDDGGRPTRDALLARMRAHIHAVVGRYRGRVHGWDVVNEALDEEGRLRRSPWLEVIGEDYIAKAFEYAQQADPGAELYYNDFNLWKPAKRDAAVRLVRQLRQQGARIDGVGEQAHWRLASPSIPEIEAAVAALAGAGVKVMFTELDVDVLPRDPDMIGADLAKQAEYRAGTNLYPDGLPDRQQQELARRYAEIFALVLKHRASLSRVTFWGVTDGHSWLNDFPVRGRTNHPLLWDRQGRAKPALDAVIDVLRAPAG